jgi:hypothetical protein
VLTSATEVSKSIHNASTRFVYDMLDAGVNSAMIDEDSPERVNANVAFRLTPASLMKDCFISKLSQVTGDFMRINSSTFTMNELLLLDANVWNKTKVIPADVGAMGFRQDGSVNDASRMSQVATMYGQSIPAYMSANGIQSLEMFQGMDGKIQLRNVRSIYQARPMQQLYQSLVSALETELFMSASFGGQMPFTVVASSSMFGFTNVSITDEYGRQFDYSFPSFADSTFAPVVSGDSNSYVRLSSDMHTLVTQVRSNANVGYSY